MYVVNERYAVGNLNHPYVSKNGVLHWYVGGGCAFAFGQAHTALSNHVDRLHVVMSPARNWVIAHGDWGHLYGTGRPLNASASRWAIYGGYPRRLLGVAERRNASRWDVLKKGRLYGHTEGPWGAPTATALLVLCD